jgi:hypothetical protein
MAGLVPAIRLRGGKEEGASMPRAKPGLDEEFATSIQQTERP